MFFLDKDLPHGINFSHMESDKFKASILTFSITIPLSSKAVAYELLLAGLLRRGCKKYPSMSALNLKLDELYGSYVEIRSSQIGENISFTVGCEVLDNKYIPDGTDVLGEVIDIVSDILLNPNILQENFDNRIFSQEKKILLDNLNSEHNNTRAYSIRRALELFQDGISQSPTLEQLKETTRSCSFEDAKNFYSNMLKSAPLDVFYIGATSPENIKKKISEAFASYPYKATERSLNFPLPYPKRDTAIATEQLPVIQGKLSMCFNSGVCIGDSNNKYYAALLLNEIFGGAPSSKLFINVREKMGLCYYCSSSYSIYTGIFTVSSGIEVKKYDTVKKAILEQLSDIKQGNISDEEIDFAKKSLSNSYTQLYDSPFDLQSFFGGRILFDISENIDDFINGVSAVTKEEIVDLAKEVSLQSVFFVEGTLKSTEGEDFLNE